MYLPFITCDKKKECFLYESSHTHRGRVSIGNFFLLGGVFIFFLGCSEDLCIFFFFSSFRDTLFLHCDSKPCTYDDTYIYMMRLLLQFVHLSLHVLFLFSLYAHASYILYAIFYFCFILRCVDKFCLKCFRNTGCQSLLPINSLLAKFFKSLY